ncbi:MAG: hypothetical protein OEY51_09775, partial [Cyclobacteriaceae bacterium]|nr:hypothetical protein [Cyclobacteriaceae bacterium]
MRYLLTFSLLVFLHNPGNTFQQASHTGMKVHFDKSFYVSGETMHFALFYNNISPLPNNQNNHYILCELYIPGIKIPARSVKLEIIKGKVEGYTDIPPIEKDAYCLFIVYAEGKSYSFPVPVYTLESNPSEDKTEPLVNDPITPYREGELMITLEGKKKAYEPRERVEITVNAGPNDKHVKYLSVSISEKNNYFHKSIESFEGTVHESTFQPDNNILGKVYTTHDSILMKNTLVVAYFLRNRSLTTYYSDAEGRVALELDRISGTDRMYLNGFELGEKRMGEGYIVLENQKKPDAPDFSFPPLSRTPYTEEYIRKKILLEKIKKIYDQPKHLESIIPSNKHDPDIISLNFNEFNTMASLRDACREFIPNTVVRKNRATGKDEIFLIEWGKSNHFRKSPLFLINGIPTLSSDTVLNLP